MGNYSIVIATAIRPTLPLVLENINDSSLLPKEVIVSIPKGKQFSPLKKHYSFNIIVIDKGIGQVSQRIEGFKKVTTSFCIQMDDDISFKEDFLNLFVNTFKTLPVNSVLAPSFFFKKEPISVLISPKPPISHFLYFILDGKFIPSYGEISKGGLPFGINPVLNKGEVPLVKTSWIPGACVIHRTENLLTNWQYPKEGKAYAEDLIHSQLLKKQKINLFIDRSLFINLENEVKTTSLNIKNFVFSRVPLYIILKKIPDLKPNFFRFFLFSIVYFFAKSINYLMKLLFKRNHI